MKDLIVLSKTTEYLKDKLKDFVYDKKKDIFTCPFCGEVICQFIPNADYKIICFKENKEFNLINIVRHLEPDKKEWEDEDIIEYLQTIYEFMEEEESSKLEISDTKLDLVLDFYEQNNFDLIPLVKNKKIPIETEKDWNNKHHIDKKEWIYWLNNGLNIGIKTGKNSNITVLDIDVLSKKEKEEIRNGQAKEERKKELINKRKQGLELIFNKIGSLLGNTLMQENLGGVHLIYKYEFDIPKTNIKIENINVDIENDGGYILVFPSHLPNSSLILDKLISPLIMNEELKKLILSLTTTIKKTQSEEIIEDIMTEGFKVNLDELKLKNNNLDGCCNSSFIKLAGILRKQLNTYQTEYVLKIFNRHLLDEPMKDRAIEAMIKQVDKYIKFDEQELAHKILDYLKIAKTAGKGEIEVYALGQRAVGEDKKRIEKALAYLMKEEYIIRKRNTFEVIDKLEWSETILDVGVPLPFKVPYFDDYAYFNVGDLIIIGSKNKWGKTSLSQNFIKRFVEQEIKPYYIYNESGGRWSKIALHLGLKDGDFYRTFCSDPNKVILENNAITIFDWVRPPDFAKTDELFNGFIEKLEKTKGLMICFVQLKDDGEFFAKNMIGQFPALLCKYLYENENDGSVTKFQITDVREAKMKGKVFEIPCKYDWETKLVKRIDEIEE